MQIYGILIEQLGYSQIFYEIPVFFLIIFAFLILNAASLIYFPLNRKQELCEQVFLYCCSAISFSVKVGTDLIAVWT